MAYSTISKPSLHFNTKLYTGNGTTDTGITGVGFQPDWVWIKSRNNGSNNNHMLFDVVRGATKYIKSDQSSAENTLTESLKSFDSDGFTVGTTGDVNQNSINFAAWNWKASNSAGSSNSDGDITATVSANTTAGFSIIKWSGVDRTGTVGHGLGAVPKMIIVKRLASRSWAVYHASVGANKKLVLDSTAAESSSTGFDDTPTSSVINVGYNDDVNGGGADYIAYCFAEKKGYSKFGNYVGNGDANGTFVYTGFKPAFVIIKKTSDTGAWYMQDNKRDIDNPVDLSLNASDSNADNNQGNIMDFLSNGIKIRTTGSGYNTSNGSYIYMAFAKEPLVANVGASIPATAR